MVQKKIALVVPVFNDWQAFGALLTDLDLIEHDDDDVLHIFAINDGSYGEKLHFQWRAHGHGRSRT